MGKRYFFSVISIMVKIIIVSVSYLMSDRFLLLNLVLRSIVIIGLIQVQLVVIVGVILWIKNMQVLMVISELKMVRQVRVVILDQEGMWVKVLLFSYEVVSRMILVVSILIVFVIMLIGSMICEL